MLLNTRRHVVIDVFSSTSMERSRKFSSLLLTCKQTVRYCPPTLAVQLTGTDRSVSRGKEMKAASVLLHAPSYFASSSAMRSDVNSVRFRFTVQSQFRHCQSRSRTCACMLGDKREGKNREVENTLSTGCRFRRRSMRVSRLCSHRFTVEAFGGGNERSLKQFVYPRVIRHRTGASGVAIGVGMR